jgi:peptidoglycan/xylan/chitin deacetylase (PgdA/CDA1 family)
LAALVVLAFTLGPTGCSSSRQETQEAPPAGGDQSPVSGRFRLDPATGDADFFLTLNPDWTAVIERLDPGAPEPDVRARGTWELDEDGAIVTLDELGGQPAPNPETLRFELVDGFVVTTEYAAEGELHNIEQAKFSIGAGERHPLVKELHRRLAAIDYLDFADPGEDLYTEETRRAVVAFQQAQGLIPDGVVSPQTWVRLGNAPPPVPTPTLLQTPAESSPEEPGAEEPPPPSAPGQWATHTGDGKPILYLTFDDGPAVPYTQQMLDLLTQYDAAGTFFVLGNSVRNQPDLVRETLSRGSYPGNHTNTHTSLSGITPEKFVQEIESTEQAVIEVAGDLLPPPGSGERYLRPPYGATDANTLSYSASKGYTVVLWDIDPQDWRQPGADVIASHILTSVYPGAIVLLHDGGGGRTQSVAALETVLRELSSQGWVFKSLYTQS